MTNVAANNIATVVQQPVQGAVETLTLTLVPKRKKKKAVKWSEDVEEVNEFSGKKTSKKCCIFHRRCQFGDWSDEDDSDIECDKCDPDKDTSAGTASGGPGTGDQGSKGQQTQQVETVTSQVQQQQQGPPPPPPPGPMDT